MDVDFGLLAQETLELSNILRQQKKLLDEIDPVCAANENEENNYDQNEDNEESQSCAIIIDRNVIPNAKPGIIFVIEKGGHTFCIKGLATSNLRFRHQQINNYRDEEAFSRLIISNDFDPSLIQYYETDTVEKADKIVKHMINRRFPIQEDVICNISDPGFSWWYDDSSDRITLFFKSHGIDRAQNLMQLGPVGDHRKAGIYFNQVFKLYGLLFPVKEFSCTSKSFSIRTSDPSSVTFRMFRRVFLEGINEFDLDYPFNTPIFSEFWHYLDQIASFRKFWLHVFDLVLEDDQNGQVYIQ